MITTATTFVIGAGASKPYGLPLGFELFKAAKQLMPKSHLYQLLRLSGHSISTLNEMRTDMEEHSAPSIDAYLLTRQHFPGWMEAGKAIIAVLMAEAIKKEKKPLPDQDWLAKVYREMSNRAANWRDFSSGNANVRFVTFNFDSIIEKRLRREITHHHGGQFSPTELDDFIGQAVIHVHGTLPQFPSVPIEGYQPEDIDLSWIQWTQTASSAINIVHDSVDAARVVPAHNAIKQADILCFLGFA